MINFHDCQNINDCRVILINTRVEQPKQQKKTDYTKYFDRYNKQIQVSGPSCYVITGKQTKQVCNQWEVVCNDFSGPHSPHFGLSSVCNYFSMFLFI